MSIRVILLEKKSSLKQGCFDDKPKYKDESIDGPWIALGHFDAIYTFKLGNDKDDVFKNIERTNTEIIPSLSDTVSSYYYPLYLIEKEGDDDRELWEREDPYIAVVRIHFSESVNISKMKEELINDVSYDKNTIGFHFYHTIELSDFILILRSSSMSEILNCALKLRKNILIGKVYTYCGIDLKHIKKLFEDNDVADNSMENNIAEKDKIQLFAMRFSVRDFKNAQDIVNGVVKILKKI